MTSQELIKKIIDRISRVKLLILAGGIIFCGLLYWYAAKISVVYSVKSTLFPQNAPADGGSSSKITQLISGSGGKTSSGEANVSIEEVGKSRKLREAVAASRMPAFNNRLMGEVLINTYNEHCGLFEKKIEMPKTDKEIVSTGSILLQQYYSIKPNKSDLIEVVFSSPDTKLLEPVSYLLIDKVTQFYKELKIEKAKADYEFISSKVDSFDNVIREFDQKRIYLDNHSMFVPEGRLEFTTPKENLQTEKMRIDGQKTNAVLNREEALWKLQKVTPIVQILDKPEPPYTPQKTSSTMYAAAGFVMGCLIVLFASIFGILYKYAGLQIHNALNPPPSGPGNISTTA